MAFLSSKSSRLAAGLALSAGLLSGGSAQAHNSLNSTDILDKGTFITEGEKTFFDRGASQDVRGCSKDGYRIVASANYAFALEDYILPGKSIDKKAIKSAWTGFVLDEGDYDSVLKIFLTDYDWRKLKEETLKSSLSDSFKNVVVNFPVSDIKTLSARFMNALESSGKRVAVAHTHSTSVGTMVAYAGIAYSTTPDPSCK